MKIISVGRTEIRCSRENSSIADVSRLPTVTAVCSGLEKVGFPFRCVFMHVQSCHAAVSKATLGSLGKGELFLPEALHLLVFSLGFTAQYSPVLFQESRNDDALRNGSFFIFQKLLCFTHSPLDSAAGMPDTSCTFLLLSSKSPFCKQHGHSGYFNIFKFITEVIFKS